MKKIVLFSIICIVSLAWLGCQYKKEVIAYPPSSICDTSSVRYSVEISNILSSNCYVCHATSVANSLGGGNKLDSYTNLKVYVNNGLFPNVVYRTPGYDPMPKNLPKLGDCDIAKIRTWIRNGALNN